MSRQTPPSHESSDTPNHDRESRAERLAVAAAAHDLNQMLAVISGRAGLLLEQVQDPAMIGHLEAIATACRDAAAMVHRLTGQDGDEVPEACDLAVEARVAASLIMPPGKGAGRPRCLVELTRGTAVGVPGQVLREVLVNLLLNAREAMDSGGTVHISGGSRSGRVRLRVADDGPGIAPEVQDRLFVPGGSGKASAGRGIGLAGCRQLLSRYGGRLELADSGDQGTVFVLDLPLPGIGAEPIAAQGEPTSAAQVDGESTGVRILVVDDELSMREMLAEVLSELGCRVTAVGDAETALAAFQPGSFQVALLDQTLPGMSGADLAANLRRNDPCLAIFLMTGWGNKESLAVPDRSAIDFTARKPMEFKDLQRLLMEAVRLQAGRTADLGRKS